MSQENVEIASNAMAALTRDGVDAFLTFCDPDIEWITPPDWLEERVFSGHDGVRQAIALFNGQVEEFHVELDRIVDVDADQVVVLLYQRGRIKGSGHTLEQPLGVATRFRDSKATRFEVYFSWKEALKAAGLEE